MKFYISYFAQFRNMSSKQICFSTAKWDPKWFHDFKDDKHKFIKNDKIYGLRADCFYPRNAACSGMPCPHSPKSCQFLKDYDAQLSKLNFEKTIDALIKAANEMKNALKIDDVDIVLLVYETPENPCSERHSLCKWFKKHGILLEEWHKDGI